MFGVIRGAPTTGTITSFAPAAKKTRHRSHSPRIRRSLSGSPREKVPLVVVATSQHPGARPLGEVGHDSQAGGAKIQRKVQEVLVRRDRVGLQEVPFLEPVHVIALGHSFPWANWMVKSRKDPQSGVGPQVLPTVLTVGETIGEQEPGCSKGSP